MPASRIGEDTFTTEKRSTKVWGQGRAEAETVGGKEGQAEVSGGGHDAGQGPAEGTALKELLKPAGKAGNDENSNFRLLQFAARVLKKSGM